MWYNVYRKKLKKKTQIMQIKEGLMWGERRVKSFQRGEPLNGYRRALTEQKKRTLSEKTEEREEEGEVGGRWKGPHRTRGGRHSGRRRAGDGRTWAAAPNGSRACSTPRIYKPPAFGSRHVIMWQTLGIRGPFTCLHHSTPPNISLTLP